MNGTVGVLNSLKKNKWVSPKQDVTLSHIGSIDDIELRTPHVLYTLY